jgi:hypothetical protein
MLQTFLQSLFFGAFLAAALMVTRRCLERATARRLRALPDGQALRCVRPLEPSRR